MAVLVTRPSPDAEATAASLRAKGYEVLLAPMLRFEPVAFHDDKDARYGAVIVTSANALRGLAPHLEGSRLLELPLFAVGEHTASAARRAGFDHVISANGDAAGLRDSVLASVKAKELKKTSPLLYLAGADLARDLAGELGERDFVADTAAGEDFSLAAVESALSQAFTVSQEPGAAGSGTHRRRRNLGIGDPAMLHLACRGLRHP